MIDCQGVTFSLQTKRTSYWFRVTEHGHLEHIYYGPLLPIQPADGLRIKFSAQQGSTVAYLVSDPNYSLDHLPLEYSGIGQGDYRGSPCQIVMPDGSFNTDFIFESYRIFQGPLTANTLPVAHGTTDDCQTLIITLTDKVAQVSLELAYTVFQETDVITRRTLLRNDSSSQVTIHKLASMMFDMPHRNFQVMSFDGDWIKETHAHNHSLQVGTFMIGSTTGASSNKHNPGIIISSDSATQNQGAAYGFNLIYSGNHQTTVELDSFGLVRITSGINPQGFTWPLNPGESFETPQAVMSFSNAGFNVLSDQLHRFVRNHIQPPQYRNLERPIVYNSWEATFFDFTQKTQLRLAKRAKELGVELFVIDDGWFAGRNDDTAGLGNYQVDSKKFPDGLAPFATQINKLGMAFGLWFEPEMVNEDSELWRQHPDWILRTPGKTAKTGRNQYVLDLCNPDVCDYIVDSVGKILDSSNISYVKWDMNRHISDAFSDHVPNQGMVYHQYVCNLYSVLTRIFDGRPQVILEMCASGGNRFDLGMLSYAAMIWSSDNTDPIERLEIQQGLSYLYPLCAISAHVSASPHQQTLRSTPLSTRFNVACFGTLGYELDLRLLNHEERDEIKDQTAFYKLHRHLFQFGQFFRADFQRENLFQWQVGDGLLAIVGNFQRQIGAAPGSDYLSIQQMAPDAHFTVTSKPQRIMIERFGALINHVIPIKLDPRGVMISNVNKYYSLRDAAETYAGTGELLSQCLYLQSQFMGTNYNSKTRLLGDFGSTLYLVQSQDV